MADRPLTTKQLKYIAGVVRGLTGVQAAMEAGYKGDEHQLSVISAQNLGKLRIKGAIDEFREEIKQESKNKIEQIDAAFADLQKRCKEKHDHVNEARCLENRAKHRGYYAEDNKQKAEQRQLTEKEADEARRLANIRLREGIPQASG